MFNCDDLIKELGEYLEDQTAVSIRKELEAHMARCRSCKVLVDSTMQTIKITTGSGSFERMNAPDRDTFTTYSVMNCSTD